MRTDPILLSDCGTLLVLDDSPSDRYQIAIEPGEHLVVEAGTGAGTPGARFTHPNIAATVKRIYQFKHDRPRNGSRWTEHAGVSHYFVFPRQAVTILPIKGYSYIPAQIAGVRVAFNVSGGTSNGWTDWLPSHTQIALGHGVRDLTKLATAASRDASVPLPPWVPLTADQEQRWHQLAAAASHGLKSRLFALVTDGTHPRVHLLPAYAADGHSSGTAVDVGQTWRHRTTCVILETPEGTRVRAPLAQIDWHATAEANNLPV